MKMGGILRSLVKAAGDLYFTVHGGAKRSYIAAAGKIIGREELRSMIDASLDMWLTAGRFNDAFEKEFAAAVGVRHALSVNSGSSANLLAMSALTSHTLKDRRLCEGDEVITVAAGFPTTIAPIVQNRLVPVFVDVDIGTYNANIEQIEKAVTKKTKAIMLAHTLGNPFDIDAVLDIAKRKNLWVIEDNCDALGSEYRGKRTGNFGHIATGSFYPAHHITMGEGGVVMTNDSALNRILLSLRDWGRDCYCPPGADNTCKRRFTQTFGKLPMGFDHKYTYSHLGYNLKITDWQAALGCAQLKRLSSFAAKRRDNFAALTEALSKHEDYFILPKAVEGASPAWFGYLLTVREKAPFTKRDLVVHLEENGIGTRELFAGNVLRQPVFVHDDIPLRIRTSKLLSSKKLKDAHYRMLPNTEAVMHGTFWIGVWPGIDRKALAKITSVIDVFIAARR